MARKLSAILVSNIAATVVTLVLSNPLVRAYGAQGVNDVLYCSMGVTLLIQGAALAKAVKRQFGS